MALSWYESCWKLMFVTEITTRIQEPGDLAFGLQSSLKGFRVNLYFRKEALSLSCCTSWRMPRLSSNYATQCNILCKQKQTVIEEILLTSICLQTFPFHSLLCLPSGKNMDQKTYLNCSEIILCLLPKWMEQKLSLETTLKRKHNSYRQMTHYSDFQTLKPL